jgi:hypothetical protein
VDLDVDAEGSLERGNGLVGVFFEAKRPPILGCVLYASVKIDPD